MREHMQIVREVAEETGVAFFDLAAEMPATPAYLADSVHVTEAGAVVKARLIGEAIAAAGFIDRWKRADQAATGTP